MATITIQDENRTISDANEVNEFLQPFGICFEKWDVEGRIGPEATNEEILEAYTTAKRRKDRPGTSIAPTTSRTAAVFAEPTTSQRKGECVRLRVRKINPRA